MYQKQISQLIGEISSLAVEVTLSGKVFAFFEHSAHVNQVSLTIASKDDYQEKIYRKSAYYDGSFLFESDRQQAEAETIEALNEMKAELERYTKESSFNKIWITFQNEIEKEIISCLKSGFNYDVETLFFDVEAETKTTPLTLNDIYEAMKLTNGEDNANFFKAEIQSNIKWLDNMVHANWSEYEREQDVV